MTAALSAEGVNVRSGPFLGALLSILPGLALAGTSTPRIPDIPAGRALASWLDAFNSGDSARFEAFKSAHAPWMITDGVIRSRALTGGYELVSIEGSGKLWIVFHAKGRVTPTAVLGRLVVRPDDPEHISLLSIVPAETRSTEIELDEAERNSVIEGAAGLLKEFYVLPDAATKIAMRLEAQRKHGDYRGITDGEVFAARLSDDLAALSGDRHIGVDYFAKQMPPLEPGSRPHPDPSKIAASNCGFEKADHYAPNIRYLKLNAFEEPDLCAATAEAAMSFVADSDALIIDLRGTTAEHRAWPR